MNYINEPKINEAHQTLNQRKIITIKKSLKLKKGKNRINKIFKKHQKYKNLRKTEEHFIHKNIINKKINDKDKEVFHPINLNFNKNSFNLYDKTKDILNENIFEKNENSKLEKLFEESFNRLKNDKLFQNNNINRTVPNDNNNIYNNPLNFPIFYNSWSNLYPIKNINYSTEFENPFGFNIRNDNNYTNDLYFCMDSFQPNNNYYNNNLYHNNFRDNQLWNCSCYNMIYPYNNINTGWSNNNYMFLNTNNNRYNNTTNSDINYNINKNIYNNNLKM